MRAVQPVLVTFPCGYVGIAGVGFAASSPQVFLQLASRWSSNRGLALVPAVFALQCGQDGMFGREQHPQAQQLIAVLGLCARAFQRRTTSHRR